MVVIPWLWTVPLLTLGVGEPSAALLDDYNACGQVCLYAVARLKDRNVDFDRVKQVVGPPKAGVHSLAEIADAGSKLDLFPIAVTADRSGLNRLHLPAIVHLKRSFFRRDQKESHFVVLLAAEERSALILDPPFRTTRVGWGQFEETWTGNLLLFADTAEEADQWRAGLESAAGYHLKRYLLLSGGLLVIVMLVTIQWDRCKMFSQKLVGAASRVVRLPRKLLTPTVSGAEQHGHRRSATRVALLVLLILVAGASPVVVGRWVGNIRRKPVLDIPGDVVRLGELVPGKANASFPIRNSGTRPLFIDRIASSCGCAVGKIPPLIKPGEKCDLELSLSISPGPRSADLVLHSNDPAGPHRLVLQWHGAAEPTLFPPRIMAADVPVGSTYERIVHIVYPGGRSAIVPEVVKSESNAPEVQMHVGQNDPFAFRTTRASSSRLRTVGYLDVHVRIESPAKAKVIDSTCQITVQYGKNKHVLTLPLRVSFVGDVRVEPQRILFSENHKSALVGKERRVKLRIGPDTGTDPVHVKELPDWLTCDLARVSATEYELCTRVSGVPRKLRETGRILLEIGSDKRSEQLLDVLTFALQE